MNQQRLELMRALADAGAAEVTVLQHLIAERCCGDFVKVEKGKMRIRPIIARRSAAYRVEHAAQTDPDLKAIFNVLFETLRDFGGRDDIAADRAKTCPLEIEATLLTRDRYRIRECCAPRLPKAGATSQMGGRFSTLP